MICLGRFRMKEEPRGRRKIVSAIQMNMIQVPQRIRFSKYVYYAHNLWEGICISMVHGRYFLTCVFFTSFLFQNKFSNKSVLHIYNTIQTFNIFNFHNNDGGKHMAFLKSLLAVFNCCNNDIFVASSTSTDIP